MDAAAEASQEKQGESSGLGCGIILIRELQVWHIVCARHTLSG